MQENYFFRLSEYTEGVQSFVNGKDRVLPDRARNEILNWIADGCRDFSISRATVDWGIRVPRDSQQTVYVWFDALIGYLSALLPEGETASPESLLKHGWPADVHIIGKDILRFHAVYWPGMLMSMGLPVPDKVYGHGFLTKDGMKMGKSLGNVLDPFQLVDTYGPDAVRCANPWFLRSSSYTSPLLVHECADVALMPFRGYACATA
jgi:methionyl-tRNA synthetase